MASDYFKTGVAHLVLTYSAVMPAGKSLFSESHSHTPSPLPHTLWKVELYQWLLHCVIADQTSVMLLDERSLSLINVDRKLLLKFLGDSQLDDI